MEPAQLWTFGHSTRTAEETVALLRAQRIARVVDVRSIPGSRRYPWFAGADMAGWLADAGIDYRRIDSLGGRRGRQPVDPEENAGWTQESFHRYADWTLGADFEAGLDRLGELADVPAAIMCAEAVPWRCHRSLIATVLVFRGWRVEHILGPGQPVPHRPGRWGPQPVLGPDGRVRYPRPGTPPLFG